MPEPTQTQETAPKSAAPKARTKEGPALMPMEDAPTDGKEIILSVTDPLFDHPVEFEAIWRHTRQMNRLTGRWEETGFWALARTGGIRITGEPVGWRVI